MNINLNINRWLVFNRGPILTWDGSESDERVVRSKDARVAGSAIFGCITVSHNERKKWLKPRKNEFQSNKNYAHPVVIYPWNTCNHGYGYAVCRGVPKSHTVPVLALPFRNTMGFSIPVPNPSDQVPTHLWFIRHLARYFPKAIAGQSMQSGGATNLAINGVPPPLIQAAGRWSSEAFQVYARKNHFLLHALLFGGWAAHDHP